MIDNKYIYKKEKTSCPISCKYCVITKVNSRRNLWNKKTIIGMNKAVTILNPPPDRQDKKAMDDFYNFPIELLKGDIVSFNALSDPFWPKYENELDYFLKKISPISKLVVCVTKFPISDKTLKRLAEISNFRLTVSITGLNSLEKRNSSQHIELLRNAKEYGIKAFPLIHPYIAGLSDLSFLPELKEMNYEYIDIKGLRYNHENMKNWMPAESQRYYINTNEKEILPEDGWREKIMSSGLKIKSLKEWYKENCPSAPKLAEEIAKKNVAELIKYANITSSDADEAVIKSAVLRRL
jgi:DNA repair photolyase